METAEEIKEAVRQKYGAIAQNPDANGYCGLTPCGDQSRPGPDCCN